MNKKRLAMTVASTLILLVSNACNVPGGSGGSSGFTPTQIVASWTGGAAGPPNDRTDIEATDFTGPMCPASGIRFSNQTEGAVLTLINDCTATVTLYVCQTKGGLAQPSLGLEECASDPLQTPMSQFKIHPISSLLGGGAEDYRNATEILSINVFFCSSSTTLSTLSGEVECI
jgi:hypothetical protein